MEAVYRIATKDDLARLWQKNIDNNPHDPRWAKWAKEYIGYNGTGQATTFAIVLDGDPVGEGTLLFSPECKAIDGRLALADGRAVGNVNALRIEKRWEGQGHVSRMVKILEDYARRRGLTALTIGVDAPETRNLAIYLHWGYDQFVMGCEEDGDLVLYYKKDL